MSSAKYFTQSAKRLRPDILNEHERFEQEPVIFLQRIYYGFSASSFGAARMKPHLHLWFKFCHRVREKLPAIKTSIRASS